MEGRYYFSIYKEAYDKNMDGYYATFDMLFKAGAAKAAFEFLTLFFLNVWQGLIYIELKGMKVIKNWVFYLIIDMAFLCHSIAITVWINWGKFYR